jgi:hypothetical protein
VVSFDFDRHWNDSVNALLHTDTPPFFAADPKQLYLLQIVRNMNALSWKRFAICSKKFVLAHSDIIGKMFFMDDSIPRHVAIQFKTNAEDNDGKQVQ